MTTPTHAMPSLDAASIADLNDLLQLDHDAVQSYTLAMEQLSGEIYRATIARYRDDHERHIRDLTQVIRRYGGQPIAAAHPSAVDKLATQTVAGLAGDTALLVAFRANERQARDKYARAAEQAAWPGDVQAVVRAAAADEQQHYDWANRTVQALGVTDDSALGAAARGVEVVHARTHDAAEAVERHGMRGVEAVRRAVTRAELGRQLDERPFAAALAVAGVGLLLGSVRRGR